MKNEVGTPVVIAIVVVVLLIVGGIGWSVFGPKGKTTTSNADKEQIFKEHPEAAAHYKAMQQNGGVSVPPTSSGH